MKTKTFKKLYHIGLMVGLQEGRRQRGSTSSQEGHCLSVSECPDAWRQIAKIGGYPLWELIKPGNAFLHAHALKKAERKLIEAWALQQGFVQAGTLFQAWSTDEEGEPIFGLYLTREEAVDELGEDAYEASDIKEVPAVLPTEALSAYCQQKVDFLDVEDMIQLCYADKVLGLDGVFWNDRLDPYAYSAPRAGILPHKLAEWSVTKVAEAPRRAA